MLESSKTFDTREEALAKLNKWKKDAKNQGQHVIGRVVEHKDKSNV